MPSTTLNGVTFAGDVFASDATRRAPKTITPHGIKLAKVLEAANGARNVVYTGPSRAAWDLEWQGAPEVTRAAVRAIFDLTTTFSATLLGGTYTVHCEPDGYSESVEFTMPGGVDYFTVKLTIYT